MAKKKFDPKAKAKRQKMMAAIGGVLLLGLLAFQVPRTMKMLKQNQGTPSSSTAATSTTSTPGSTPLAPPALDGSSAAPTSSGTPIASASATSADGVVDPSNPLPPSAGQLVSFSEFQSKDPFHQQIADCASASGSSSSSTVSSPCASVAKAAAKSASKKTPAAALAVSAKAAPGTPAAAPANVSKATITVNGIAGIVSVGSSFPASSPVFTLVSLTPRAAKIGIAGGSYENGAATVTLAKGKTVTLMNTADGTRYLLRLVAVA
jgi:hypothetical protein